MNLNLISDTFYLTMIISFILQLNTMIDLSPLTFCCILGGFIVLVLYFYTETKLIILASAA